MIITLLKAASDSLTQFAPGVAKTGPSPLTPSNDHSAVIFLFGSLIALFIIGMIGGYLFPDKPKTAETEQHAGHKTKTRADRRRLEKRTV